MTIIDEPTPRTLADILLNDRLQPLDYGRRFVPYEPIAAAREWGLKLPEGDHSFDVTNLCNQLGGDWHKYSGSELGEWGIFAHLAPQR